MEEEEEEEEEGEEEEEEEEEVLSYMSSGAVVEGHEAHQVAAEQRWAVWW